MKGNAHGHKKLGCGKVYTRHHLRRGMLHLKARVEFQEIKHVFSMTIKVYRAGLEKVHSHIETTPLTFYCACANVANEFGQANRGTLHLLEFLRIGDSDGCLFNNLLMPSLDRAITTEKRNCVSILVRQELYLQMTSLTS